MKIDNEKKELKGIELETVTHIKKTFARELSIQRLIPYQFLRKHRAVELLNTFNKILDGKTGFNITTLARIADMFGYDVKLVRRKDSHENQG